MAFAGIELFKRVALGDRTKDTGFEILIRWQARPATDQIGNPKLAFDRNFFHTFTPNLLDFPGANNMPLGSLSISGNKVLCPENVCPSLPSR